MKIAFHPDTHEESSVIEYSNKKFESRRHPCAFRIRRPWGKGVEEAEPSREEARVDSPRSRAEYRINSPRRDDKRTLPTPRIGDGGETTFGSDSRGSGDRAPIEWSFRGNFSRLEWIRVKHFGKFAIVPERGIPFFLNRNVPKARSFGASSPLSDESARNEWKVTI